MLSVIRSPTTGQHFAVFVVGNIFDGLEVKVTNGHDLYIHDGLIREETHKPQSRSKESKISYMNTLYSALTSSSISSKDTATAGSNNAVHHEERFIHDFNMNSNDDSIQLVIKERVANTSTMSILFRSSFQKQFTASAPFPSTVNPIMNLFLELQINVTTKQQTIECLERDNKRHQELNDGYVKDIKLLNDLKDTLQDTMIQRMCIILNSKKLELLRLQDRIEELESAMGQSGQTIVSQSQTQSQTVTTVAKRGRKKATDVAPAAASKKTRKTATSVDTIQKKAAAKSKGTTKTKAKVKSSKKRGKNSNSEDEDEDEPDSDDRDFIVDDDEDEEENDEDNDSQDSDESNRFNKGKNKRTKALQSSEEQGEDDSAQSESDDHRRSKSALTRTGSSTFKTQSFLTQKAQSMEVDSADIMNFLSHKNVGGYTQMSRGNSLTNNDKNVTGSSSSSSSTSDHAALKKEKDAANEWQGNDNGDEFAGSSFGTTRRGKRSANAFLSQDVDDEFTVGASSTKPLPSSSNASTGALSSEPIPSSLEIKSASAAASSSVPAAKKKRSERFFDSDDEADGCLNFI